MKTCLSGPLATAASMLVLWMVPAAHAGSVSTVEVKGAGKVKLILTNGRIRTPNGLVEAMAINTSGIIIAVGVAADVDRLRLKDTRVIDLKGHTVLPGFNDMHVHPIFAGLQALRCVIPQGSTLATIQHIVKSCADKTGPRKWITGGQWDEPAIGQAPNRAMLDAVSPRNPVLLGDSSVHSAWANSLALKLAGVNRDTPNPEGGIIERDASGEPTGLLREEAVFLVRKHVPAPTSTEVRSALTWSLATMLSFGITSFTEAAAGFSSSNVEKEVKAYAALADAGVLKQRTRLCLSWEPGNADAEATIVARNLYIRDRLSVDCVKMFLDGVPTQAQTAAMLEPYAGTVGGRADEASRKGMLLLNQGVIDAAVTRFDRLGLAVKFHAAGDAAVRAGLNGIEAARKANGFSGVLHDIGHSTFVSREDVPRARVIGATFEVSPYLWAPSPITDEFVAAVGRERIERVWPVREMLDAGALVVPGSDWPVVLSVNPWIAVEMLVTREQSGGGDRSFGKAEAISLKEALDLFTVNAARHRQLEGKVGQIAPGMLADVIIVSHDPFEVPVRKLHEVQVLTTIISGEVVFQR